MTPRRHSSSGEWEGIQAQVPRALDDQPADRQMWLETTRDYISRLDSQIGELEAQLLLSRKQKRELQQAVAQIARLEKELQSNKQQRSALTQVFGVLGGSALARSFRQPAFTRPDDGGTAKDGRWKVAAGTAAVLAVGAGLSLAGQGGRLDLPNAISLRDRVPVAEAAEIAPPFEIVSPPVIVAGADDSPFDDPTLPAAAGWDSPDDSPNNSPATGSGGLDSPDDSPVATGGGFDSSDDSPVAQSGTGFDSPEDSPDDSLASLDSPDDSPIAQNGGGLDSPDDSPEASNNSTFDSPDDSPEGMSVSVDSPDDSASFDSPDNT